MRDTAERENLEREREIVERGERVEREGRRERERGERELGLLTQPPRKEGPRLPWALGDLAGALPARDLAGGGLGRRRRSTRRGEREKQGERKKRERGGEKERGAVAPPQSMHMGPDWPPGRPRPPARRRRRPDPGWRRPPPKRGGKERELD